MDAELVSHTMGSTIGPRNDTKSTAVVALPNSEYPPFQVVIHSLRGDATNSEVFKRSKVHNLELFSLYCTGAGHDTTGREAFETMFSWSLALADIQLVKDFTGPGTHGMVLKQLRSLACR
eukprot:4396427-Alexandrium_andersonii.AAC.1